jgi:cytochrome c556
MSAPLAIQQMIFSKLTGDAGLTVKISGVFDAHPEPQVFPYVTLGDGYSNPFVQFERMGEEVYCNIHIWSRYKGFKESQEISADIQRLLAQQEHEVDEFGTVACYFDTSETMRDVDGITRHVILRYRFLIQY